MHDNQDSNQTPFIFIAGCPRSGTYLLASILRQYFDIAIPVETHFIPLFYRYKNLFGNLQLIANRRRLLTCIFEFLELFTEHAEKERNRRKIRQYSILSVQPYFEQIVAQSTSYNDIVSLMFLYYARAQGKVVVGDKSAIFHAVSPETLCASVNLPVKIIHLIRDGRDVALSWMQMWSGPPSIPYAAISWAKHISVNHHWGKKHQHNYFEVRYEDLIQNPETTIAQLGEFLGLQANSIDALQLGDEQTALISNSTTHARLNGPLHTDSIEKWRNKLRPRDINYFNRTQGNLLTLYGYSVDQVQTSSEIKFATVRDGFRTTSARLIAHFSPHQIRIKIKFLLPLWLYLRYTLKKVLTR
ncbi:sulfotransferase [Oleiphilus messinensis]|uniref:Sulfotransferase n=1 Tax=Oleiphilus messinensis TaxID=141451 RepID=A0A1Y0IJF0_9GAMM|nr:sulfotransferase [Oleiphilus messinensis]ARU59514.1 sulfotransferase [Oleiphilus messinensis]